MEASRHASVVRVYLLACGGFALLLAAGCTSEPPTPCQQAAAHINACLGSQVDAIDESFSVERCQSIVDKPCPTERQTAEFVGGFVGGVLCHFGVDCGEGDSGGGQNGGDEWDPESGNDGSNFVGGLVGGVLCHYGEDCGVSDGGGEQNGGDNWEPENSGDEGGGEEESYEESYEESSYEEVNDSAGDEGGDDGSGDEESSASEE